jgi:hypothetical protein
MRAICVAVVVALSGCVDVTVEENPTCGDGVCTEGEASGGCALDCGVVVLPFCGDGVCSADESPQTCASDCPAVACTADPASCAGDTICSAGVCVPAFGRAYTIIVHSMLISTYTPDGLYWDAGGGAPDPYVIIWLDGVSLATTSYVADSFVPMWNEAAPPAIILPGSRLQFDVWDSDVTIDDGIMTCVAAPLTADQLHGGKIVCDGLAGRFEARLVAH